jgi:transposase
LSLKQHLKERRCLVGLEACGSAHHWARELIKLGHDARMMPPAYVKPYIRRQKNDASDAAAICEAVTRPSMRFVGVRYRGQIRLRPHSVSLALTTSTAR